ncbi:hypothetical protein EI94DRAFT_1772386 [Lactarius quietus]|nr:hypothetical protein EI94DRAFT_1772386 [Lactarius quietus]
MSPPTDLQEVLESEIKYLLTFADIYFHQKNEDEHQAALQLRDAVLRLRRDGAFVAVPLWRVNLAQSALIQWVRIWFCSYEIWCPSESFVSVFSYLCMNRGDLRYELPRDHEVRNAWIELGYSSEAPQLSLEARRRLGENVERILEGEKEAAKAPVDPIPSPKSN